MVGQISWERFFMLYTCPIYSWLLFEIGKAKVQIKCVSVQTDQCHCIIIDRIVLYLYYMRQVWVPLLSRDDGAQGERLTPVNGNEHI